MILYYVRHADPIYEPDSITELGKKQAEALAKRFKLYGLDEVYASSSNRARMTAKPTCDALGLEMKICDWAHEDLAEADTGLKDENGEYYWSFANREMAEKFNDPAVRALGMEWYTHEYFRDLPFGRGIKRIENAVDEWLLSLGYKHDRENCCYRKVGKSPERVALFAHVGVSMMILSALFDIPYPQLSTRCCMSHTGVTAIGFGTAGFPEDAPIYPQMLQHSNDSHLYKEGLLTGYNNELNI